MGNTLRCGQYIYNVGKIGGKSDTLLKATVLQPVKTNIATRPLRRAAKLVAIFLCLPFLHFTMPAYAISEFARSNNWFKAKPGTQVVSEIVTRQNGKPVRKVIRKYTLMEKSSSFATVEVDSNGEKRSFTYAPIDPSLGSGKLQTPFQSAEVKLRQEPVTIAVHGAASKTLKCNVFQQSYKIQAFPNREQWTHSMVEITTWRDQARGNREVRRVTKNTKHFNNIFKRPEAQPEEDWQLKTLAVPVIIGQRTYLCDLEESNLRGNKTVEQLWVSNEIPTSYAIKSTAAPFETTTETVISIEAADKGNNQAKSAN